SELRERLPTLVRPPGRPRVERSEGPASMIATLRGEALRFVIAHPGCVRLEGKRSRYGDAWRRFVLERRERHPDLALGEFADALCMPLGTIVDWLREPRAEAGPGVEGHTAAAGEHDAKHAQIETVLAA